MHRIHGQHESGSPRYRLGERRLERAESRAAVAYELCVEPKKRPPPPVRASYFSCCSLNQNTSITPRTRSARGQLRCRAPKCRKARKKRYLGKAPARTIGVRG
jgi:hypothetical protein